MGRRVCLSIGVAYVEPPLNEALKFGYLDGAIPAAKAIGKWALGSGFGEENVRIITDDRGEAVTEDRVKEAVNELIDADVASIDHMILSFCGHGLTDANAMSISWLFSDSITSGYRVLANRMYSELQRFGVKRITLFSDACREAPKDLDLMRLDPRRVVVALQDKRVKKPIFDKFAACQDGQLGYMVKSSVPAEPGKCIFSGVIADILWGQVPDAIRDGKVGVLSLGEFADKGTEARADTYNLELYPEIMMHWSDATLYDESNPPTGDLPLQPWPEPDGAVAMGVTPTESATVKAEKVIKRLRKGLKPSRELFGKLAEIAGVSSSLVRGAMHQSMVREVVMLNEAASDALAVEAPDIRQRKRQRVEQLAIGVEQDQRKQAAQTLRRSVSQIKIKDGQRPDLVVMGKHRTIWSSNGIGAGASTRARTNYSLDNPQDGVPVMVEYESGLCVPFVPYADTHAVVRPDNLDRPVVLYGGNDSVTFPGSLQWIQRFVAGELRPSDIAEVAANLRHGKHRDPSMGAVCAYLYASIADVDSIRRMAYFYADIGQAIPFDIALLGEMAVTRDTDGNLKIEVPEVAARDVDSNSNLPSFVTRATPSITGIVGGRCPWLGLGWDHVALAREDARDLVSDILEFAPDISREGFTAFGPENGPQIAARWGLSRSE